MTTPLDEFGTNLVLLKGWDLRPSDYYTAWTNQKLITAQIETSNLCDLACVYCFREENGAISKKRLPGEISPEDTIRIVDELANLEIRTINIIGAGEPTIDPFFPELIKYISTKKITPVVFTHGARLNEKLISLIDETQASVIIKVNSFQDSVQDKLVERIGYTQKRNEGLRLLIEAGLNKPTNNYQTRLGIDSVVCKENQKEILGIHRYCRENNIMPLIKTFIPAGRTKTRTDLEISMKKFIDLSKQAQEIDQTEFNIHYSRLIPYFGGIPCTQCGQASIYVTILGDIFECPGQQKRYGNLRDISVKDAVTKMKAENVNAQFGCPPRMAYWKSLSDHKLITK